MNHCVAFDIGHTLMKGPSISLSPRIGSILAIPAEKQEQLDAMLFREDFADVDNLLDAMSRRGLIERRKLASEQEVAVREIWTLQEQEGSVVDGAMELIQQLHKEKTALALISNIWRPYYTCFANLYAAVMDYFPPSRIILSFKTGVMKPDRGIYERFLTQNSFAPQNVTMIGDSYGNDIAPTKALGMNTVWILDRPEKERIGIVDVINGNRPKPGLTVSRLSDITISTLRNLRTHP